MEATKMSYNEAVDLILKFKDRTGRIPTKKDYEKKRNKLSANELAKALGINMKEKNKRDVPAWAAINVEVVHAERARQGRPVEIEADPMSQSNANLFDNRYPEEEE